MMYKTIAKIDNIIYIDKSINNNIKKLINYNSIIILQSITKYLFKNNINIDNIYDENELYYDIIKQLNNICNNQIKIFKAELYNNITHKEYIQILEDDYILYLINNLRIKKDKFLNIEIKDKEFSFDYEYKIYNKNIENIIKNAYNKEKNETYFININNFDCNFDLQLKNNISYTINLNEVFEQLIKIIQKYSSLNIKITQYKTNE